MSSDEIDMAFYCNHMALHLVNMNDHFVIYGPVIMNCETMVFDGDMKDISILGIGQKREHIRTLAEESYSQLKEIKEMSPEALPYAMKNKQINAAIIDVTKAALLPSFKYAPISKNDYVSYCLVVRKNLIGTDAFYKFLDIYNKAVEELNKKETLIEELGMTEEFWNVINIKFLKLE